VYPTHWALGKMIGAAAATNAINATAITVSIGWTWPAISEQGLVTIGTAALVIWGNYQAKRTQRIVRDVHTLTNSAMGDQLLGKVELLEAMLVLAQRLAESGTDADIAAADALAVRVESAKVKYAEHQLQQARVDASH
jgi:hypothetical protein